MTETTQLLSHFMSLLDIARVALSEATGNTPAVTQVPDNPLLSLPYDIHCELFEWLASLDPPSFSRDQLRGYRVEYRGWIALSQVCRGLRSVALEQPHLWARVVLVPASESTRSIFLERSGEAGLTFRFNGNTHHPSEHGWLIERPEFSQIIGNPNNLDFCARYLSRAEELSISVPIQWLDHLVGARLPLLRTLHLCASDAAFTEVPHMPSEWLQAPNLIGVSFCDTKFPLYAPSLRYVTLQNCNWVQHPDLIPPAAIFGQLRAAPLLEEVKLHNVLTRNNYPDIMDEGPPIALPHLKRFYFRGSLSGLESLITILRVPDNVALDVELCGDFNTPPTQTCSLPTLVRRLATNFHKHAEPSTRFFELSVCERVPGELPFAWPGMAQTPWTRINPGRLGIKRNQALGLCIPRMSSAGVSLHSDVSDTDPLSEPVYAPELQAALYTGAFVPFNGSQLRVLAIRHSMPKIPLESFFEVIHQLPQLAELYLDEALATPLAKLSPMKAALSLPNLGYVVYRGLFGVFRDLWACLDAHEAVSLHLGFLDEQTASSLEDRHFLTALFAQEPHDTSVYLSYLDLDWSLHGYFVHCGSKTRHDAALSRTTLTGQHVVPGVFLCLNQSRSKGEHSSMYRNPRTVMQTFLSVIDPENIDTVEMDFGSLLHLRGDIKSVLEIHLRQLSRVRCVAFCHGAPLGQLYTILASTVIASSNTQAAHCFPQLDSLVERCPAQADWIWMEHYRKQRGHVQTQWAALQGIVRDRLWFNKPIRCVEVLKPPNFLLYGEDPEEAAEGFEENLAYTLTLGCDMVVGELL
ncbi:hypothetical protein PENSPDRAFT_754259 [Peniophora sp. CONT]|nr:hypothetical protein PENSPDRAFT_754259 [Peniophora sp. CONT]